MKYTKEQRLDIGRRIYDGEITKYEAAEQYDISYQTARDYMRLYQLLAAPIFVRLFPSRTTSKSMNQCQKKN